jgi:FtsZ-binding cell division protein ZapB
MRKLEINEPLVLEFRGSHLYYTSEKYVTYFPGEFMHPLKSGTRWEVSVKRIVGDTVHVTVKDYHSEYGIQSFQNDLGNVFSRIFFVELSTDVLLSQFDRSGASGKRPKSSGAPEARPESLPFTPSPEKPKVPELFIPKVSKVNVNVQVEIEDLKFRTNSLSCEVNVQGAKNKVELMIHDEAIKEAFGNIKPYICKCLRKKSVKIVAEVEIGIDRTGRCITAHAPELAIFLRRDIEEIKADLLVEGFFESNSEAQGFVEVGILTAIVEELGGEELSPKTLIQNLQKRQKAKHALELNYLAERHRNPEMKLHFLKEAMSFLFLVEGRNRFHLVLEVYDKTFATYIWHCGKDGKSLEATVNAVKGDAGMLASGNRQAYKSGKSQADFKAIQHRYEGDRNQNFENWKQAFNEACD